MKRFADWFSEHRTPLAVAVVVMTAVAGFGLSRLGFDDRPRGIFKSNDEAHALLEEIFADFGSDDNDCILVVEADDLFKPEPIAALRELITAARQTEGVQHVRSMDDAVLFESGKLPRSLLPAADAPSQALARARRDALAHPLIGGQILSENGQMTLLIVRLAGESLGVNEIQPIVTHLRQINARINDSGAVRARLTGIPPARVEIYEMLQREQIKFGVSGALLGILVAYLLFRRAAAVLIVVAAPLTGTLWTLGALGLVGEKLNVINNVLPTLVLVIGFTDAVHLMHDLRRSRRNRLTPKDAAKSAIRHLVLACALTSITTAIGFGSLSVGRLEIIRHFGFACAVGTVLSFLAVITIVPLLASTRLGRRIHVQHDRRSPAKHLLLLDAIAISVTRRAGWFAVIGTILTLALGATVLRLKPDNSLREAMPTSNESFQALQACDEQLGGILIVQVLIEWSPELSLASPAVLDAVREAQSLLEAEPLINYPVSVLDLLASLPGPPGDPADRIRLLALVPDDIRRRFVAPNRRRTVVTARTLDAGTAVYAPVFAKLRQDLNAAQSEFAGVTLRLTGTTVVAVQNLNRMIRDLTGSLLLAAVVIFGVIWAAFRSFRVGLISVLPNVFPLVVTASLLAWRGGTLQIPTAIVFTVCLGIAVDDTIHFITRFLREVRIDGDVPEAIRRTMVAVGSALITTTAVLVAGFGTLLLSEMWAMRAFASSACVALLAALVGDLVLLPALLVCFVRRRWTHLAAGITPADEEHGGSR